MFLHLEEHSKPLTNCSDWRRQTGQTSDSSTTQPQGETALHGAAVWTAMDLGLITLPGCGPALNVFCPAYDHRPGFLLEVGTAFSNLEADSCCVRQKGQDKIN